MSNKSKHIGRSIARQLNLRSIVTVNMEKAIKKRHKLVTKLNKIADNKELVTCPKTGEQVKKYSSDKVNQAKKHLRNMYKKTHVLKDMESKNNDHNSWRPAGNEKPARK